MDTAQGRPPPAARRLRPRLWTLDAGRIDSGWRARADWASMHKPWEHLTVYGEVAADVAAQVREARLDHAAFERPLKPCELDRCRATCCHDGVHLSAAEAAMIDGLAVAGALDAYGVGWGAEVVEARNGAWKTRVRPAAPAELAIDYPPHFPATRCVLLDAAGRCALQRLAIDQDRHQWYFKPLTCWLHPLALRPPDATRARPELTVHGPADDPQRADGYPGFASCTHCGRPDPDGVPARAALAAELGALGLLAGRDLLGELNAPEFPAPRD